MSVADPVIVALLNRLPSIGSHWPLDERLAWLHAMEASFNLIYGRDTIPIFIKASPAEVLKEHDDKVDHAAVVPTPPMVDPPKPRRTAPVVTPQVLPRLPAKVRMPAVKPTAGPRPTNAPIKFDHNDRTTYLATMREYVVAGKLRAAMGKGHVAEAFLASEVIGSNTESNRDVVRLLCHGMNESLAEVGLVIEHHPGYGLLMKDLA